MLIALKMPMNLRFSSNLNDSNMILVTCLNLKYKENLVHDNKDVVSKMFLENIKKKW